MGTTLLLAYFLHNFAPHGELPQEVLRQQERSGTMMVEVVTPDQRTSVPPGATRVEMFQMRMSVPCGQENVPVEAISVQRRGMGSTEDITGVYAIVNGKRMTRSHPITRRDGWVQLRFREFEVPACGTIDVKIHADFSSEASPAGEHYFVLYHPRHIEADARQIIVTQRKSVRAVRETVGRKLGTVSVTYLQLLKRVKYGFKRDVMRFQLEADSIDDHLLRVITLTNDGAARFMDLQNLYLTGTRGPVTGRIANMDDDTVRLVFEPPVLLKKNEKRIFVLRANVLASRRRTIKFIVEEPGDLISEVVRGRRSGVEE